MFLGKTAVSQLVLRNSFRLPLNLVAFTEFVCMCDSLCSSHCVEFMAEQKIRETRDVSNGIRSNLYILDEKYKFQNILHLDL